MPVVALLSDFGLHDHYVGAMKGAILGVCPAATLVDVVHELPAHDVVAGAFALAAAMPAFPPGTVFVAVVDPGVGSSRRGLGASVGPWLVVAPDNGLLTVVWEEQGAGPVHHLTNAALFRGEVAPTFHGRDVFGPVAGFLAGGLALPEVGPAIDDPVRLPFPRVAEAGPGLWAGAVLQVDRFGNLTTNFGPAELRRLMATVGDDPTALVVEVEGVRMPLVGTYAEVAQGEPCAVVGSSGRIEIAANGTSAARLLGAGRGWPVTVRGTAVDGGGGML